MSLWSKSSPQEGLVLLSHEADEAPCGEQLLCKYPQKQMEKNRVQTCSVKTIGPFVHLPEGIRSVRQTQ